MSDVLIHHFVTCNSPLVTQDDDSLYEYIEEEDEEEDEEQQEVQTAGNND